MNVLLLGTVPSPLRPILEATGCQVRETAERIELGQVSGIDFIVSYRYRHILREVIIDGVGGNAINLHISLLPWNKGADPNLWSFLEDTPKGCTLHYIDKGVDTGDIIAQAEIRFVGTEETLSSTYSKLNEEMVRLFARVWPRILRGEAGRTRQAPGGSAHKSKDRLLFEHLLAEKGWETPVLELQGKAIDAKMHG